MSDHDTCTLCGATKSVMAMYGGAFCSTVCAYGFAMFILDGGHENGKTRSQCRAKSERKAIVRHCAVCLRLFKAYGSRVCSQRCESVLTSYQNLSEEERESYTPHTYFRDLFPEEIVDDGILVV